LNNIKDTPRGVFFVEHPTAPKTSSATVGRGLAPAVPHRFHCQSQHTSGGSKRPPYNDLNHSYNKKEEEPFWILPLSIYQSFNRTYAHPPHRLKEYLPLLGEGGPLAVEEVNI
jgi:hypothetical protein